MQSPPILHVVIPTPLRHRFDYLPPIDSSITEWTPGVRLRVPFGRREAIGLLIGTSDVSDVPPEKLKPVPEVMDDAPSVSASIPQCIPCASGV